MIYSSKHLKQKFQEFLTKKVSELDYIPSLDIVQFGDLLASTKYIEIKQKIGLKIGIDVLLHKFSLHSNKQEVHIFFESLNQESQGYIIQLPLPEQYSDWVKAIPSTLDVDMLGEEADKLWDCGLLPPTIMAIDIVLKDCMEMFLDGNVFEYKLDDMLPLEGKVVAVVGQGVLVGKPLLKYLADRQATIVSINKFTKDPQNLTSKADIIITAAGYPNLINSSWCKQNAIIIDAGTSEVENKLAGDVDRLNLREDILLCPSPGGIGGLTVLSLFYNLLSIQKLYA